MKNKASLVLLEQLIMILVFALAAAACLRIFAWSDRTGREMERQGQAVILCQNAAEILKSTGSLKEAEAVLEQDSGFILELQTNENSVPGLGQAKVRVYWKDTGQLLFSLPVGWQEVLP